MRGHSLVSETKQLLSTWWRIMTHPSPATFEQAAQDISLRTALVGLVFAETLRTVVWRGWLSPPPSGGVSAMLQPILYSLLGLGLVSFLFLIAGLLVTGRGRFSDYLHLFALFESPLLLLGLVLDPLPLLPPWTIRGLLLLYRVTLTIQALRAIHRYAVPRALLTLGVATVAGLGFGLLLTSLFAGPFVAITALREIMLPVAVRSYLGLADRPGLEMNMTLEEARQAVDFPVRAPTELPEGYEFEGARVMRMIGQPRGDAIVLQYRSGSEILSIQQSLASPEGWFGPGEEITVRDHPGVLREMGFGRMLIWKEEGVLFSMFHNGKLSPEQLLAVAESLQ